MMVLNSPEGAELDPREPCKKQQRLAYSEGEFGSFQIEQAAFEGGEVPVTGDM